jgi:hypothetical protein
MEKERERREERRKENRMYNMVASEPPDTSSLGRDKIHKIESEKIINLELKC